MLNIAVIGAGRIGHVHAKTIAAYPQARLALVCDPFEDSAEKLAAVYMARSCKDAEEVFAHGSVRLETAPVHTVHALETRIPEQRLTAVTGVSSSGKTTLVLEALVPALASLAGGWALICTGRALGALLASSPRIGLLVPRCACTCRSRSALFTSCLL